MEHTRRGAVNTPGGRVRLDAMIRGCGFPDTRLDHFGNFWVFLKAGFRRIYESNRIRVEFIGFYARSTLPRPRCHDIDRGKKNGKKTDRRILDIINLQRSGFWRFPNSATIRSDGGTLSASDLLRKMRQSNCDALYPPVRWSQRSNHPHM